MYWINTINSLILITATSYKLKDDEKKLKILKITRVFKHVTKTIKKFETQDY